jgi:MFS family permease
VFCIVGGMVIFAGLAVGLVLEPGERPQPEGDTARSTASDTPSGPPALGWRRGWTRAIVRLGLIGFVLMICEGAALGWSGIFLRDSRGTTLELASTAVVAFTACQTVGRLFGDRLRSMYGDATVFRAGVLIGTAGLALAVLQPVPTVSIVGFAILGLGGSVLLPVTYGAVGRAAPTGHQAAVMSRFTTFTYAGILLGPALIGWIAEVINLQWTLAVLIPLLGILAVAHPFAEPLAERPKTPCTV